MFSRLAIVGVAVFSGILLAVAAGLHAPLFRLLRLGDAPQGWWYFFLFLLTQWPGLFFEQVLTVRGNALGLAIFGGLSALGFTLALVIPLYYGAGLAHALFILAVFSAVKGLVILGWVAVDHWKKSSPYKRSEQHLAAAYPLSSTERKARLSRLQAVYKPWLSTSWPLIAYATVGALVTAFDPWFVNYWYEGDESIFATFRYGARELPLLAAITNGAMVVVLPRLTEDTSAGLDLLKASSRRLFHWIFGGAILLMMTSPWWWTLVFTELFSESLPLFQAYLFVVVSRLLFPVPVLTAMGHTRLLMVFGFLELVINVVLSILLVPYFGLLGIIWATVIAYLVDKLCLMAYLKYRTGIPSVRYTDYRWFGAYVGILVLAYLLVR